MIAFVRRATDPNDFLLLCCNFTPVVRKGYDFGVPAAGIYDEVFNTDSECFGGGNVINVYGGIQSRPRNAMDGRRVSPSRSLRWRS